MLAASGITCASCRGTPSGMAARAVALWRAAPAQLDTPGVILPVLGFTVTLLMLGSAAEARELYALPMLVRWPCSPYPASLVTAGPASGCTVQHDVFTFFIIVGWFYWSALELGVPARLHNHLHTIRPGYDFGFRWVHSCSASPIPPAGCYCWRNCAQHERPLIIWAGGITAVWALLATLFIGWADTPRAIAR